MMDPIGNFLDYIHSKTSIDDNTRLAVRQVVKIVDCKKNHYLLKEGMTVHHIWFVVSGSVRVYYAHDEKEVTSWIYNEQQMVTAYGNFFNRTISYDNIQCTEDCLLVSITYDKLMELYSAYPKMQEFGRILMEEIIGILDNFFKGFMFMSAKEKYDLLLSFFPDVTQRVNLGHIASFLGVSQETLSRIRNRKTV